MQMFFAVGSVLGNIDEKCDVMSVVIAGVVLRVIESLTVKKGE